MNKVSSYPLFLILIFETFLLIVLLLKANETAKYVENEGILDHQKVSSTVDYVGMIKNWTNEFKELAHSLGIDKETHHYYNLYGTHLGPIKHRPLNFLEIGLGCTMNYGAGKSLLAWRKYIPNARVSFIEYNAACAEPFRGQLEHLFIGDQSDFKFLQTVGEQAGPFDFIVDDGGHKRAFQINSFLGLWSYLKPNGGVYVIEDMFFSFYKNFANHNETSIDLVHKLIMLQNDALVKGNFMLPVDDTQFSPQLRSIYKSILSINCYYRACVFVKK